jgi:hypothetical protein
MVFLALKGRTTNQNSVLALCLCFVANIALTHIFFCFLSHISFPTMHGYTLNTCQDLKYLTNK